MPLRGIKKQLVNNSVDAFVLSLETINRLTVRYRIEAFCMLLCNAWELLMKARIVVTEGRSAIYYSGQRGKDKRTLSGKDCVRIVFPRNNDSVRRNLEAVIDLRDEAVHLVLSSVPPNVLELLQACVLNYHKSLQNWFDFSLDEKVPYGMMAFVFEPAALQKDIAMLRKQLGAPEIKFLTKFQGRIQQEAVELGYATEFVSRVEHRVWVVNRPGQADVTLTAGESGEQVQFIEKPRDPATTHPLRTKKLVEDVRSRTNLERPFNQHCFLSVCYAWKVRKHSEWFYRSEMEGSTSQYSTALADKIVTEINEDPGFVDRCRTEFKASQSEARDSALKAKT